MQGNRVIIDSFGRSVVLRCVLRCCDVSGPLDCTVAGVCDKGSPKDSPLTTGLTEEKDMDTVVVGLVCSCL